MIVCGVHRDGREDRAVISRLLISGGTGSLGRALAARLLADPSVTRLVLLSRDEVKQAEMAEALGRPEALSGRDPVLRLFLGDVRDRERLEMAMRGCDAVIHAAALKRVETGSYQPEEMVRTNVQGTINVIKAAVAAGVSRVLVVSSDKAVNPTTLYGATKFVAERFAVASNSFAVPQGCRVGVVRYGNVIDSRGAVLHRFRQSAAAGGPIRLTDPECTRFVMTLEQAATVAPAALTGFAPGETWVPSWLPAARMADVAEAVALGVAVEVIGLRPGTDEKRHEELLTAEEAARACWAPFDRAPEFYVITPAVATWTRGVVERSPAKLLGAYRSDTTTRLTVEEIRGLVG